MDQIKALWEAVKVPVKWFHPARQFGLQNLIMPITMEPAKPDRLTKAVCEHTNANVQELAPVCEMQVKEAHICSTEEQGRGNTCSRLLPTAPALFPRDTEQSFSTINHL